MKFPTLAQVESASHRQLAEWHRFCPCPLTDENLAAMNRNYERLYKEFDGFTVDLSKSIGWEPR